MQVTSRPVAFVLHIGVVMAIGLSPMRGFAQDDTITYFVALGTQYDDNLFRLPAGLSPRPYKGEASRGDWLDTATFGIVLRKSWSLQQIEANFQHSENHYRHYSYLDNGINSHLLAWRWQVTPRVKGSLTHQRTQALADFGDYREFARNLRSIESVRLSADWRVGGGLFALAEAEVSEVVNSQPFVAEQSNRTNRGLLGLRYQFRSGNWLELRSQRGDGQYLGRDPDPVRLLDTGFTDRRDEVRGFWARGKSQIEAAMGRQERHHDHYPARDYAGPVASLKASWLPTGKLAVHAHWRTELAAYVLNNASYYRQNSVSLAPVWQVSPKLRLGLALEQRDRVYRGAPPPNPAGDRKEVVRSLRATADWSPWQQVRLTGQLGHEVRSADSTAFDYTVNLLGVSVQASF